ncbi:hypothetical protein ACFZB5_13970 [Streptomyces nodosus]|uniref:hypothetical protein n=1 Tax=Streptomyces nodosus TaxID=40318 RepID=UPI0036ED6B1F
MDLTAGTKATAAMSMLVMAVGITAILYGAIRNDLARSVGGACLAIAALTLIALISIQKWITDTSEERRILAAATRQAQDERTRYIAAQAALENERGRLHRDLAAARARIAPTLAAERTKLAAEFEEDRARLISESFETGVLMERAGMLKPGAPAARESNLIQFPGQEHARLPERERSRGRGGVVP